MAFASTNPPSAASAMQTSAAPKAAPPSALLRLRRRAAGAAVRVAAASRAAAVAAWNATAFALAQPASTQPAAPNPKRQATSRARGCASAAAKKTARAAAQRSAPAASALHPTTHAFGNVLAAAGKAACPPCAAAATAKDAPSLAHAQAHVQTSTACAPLNVQRPPERRLRRVFFETDAARRARGRLQRLARGLVVLEDVVHVLLGVPAPGLGLGASERALRQEKVRERAHDGAERRGEPQAWVLETTSPKRIRQPPEPDRRAGARRRAQQLGALRRESPRAACRIARNAPRNRFERVDSPRLDSRRHKPGGRRGADTHSRGTTRVASASAATAAASPEPKLAPPVDVLRRTRYDRRALRRPPRRPPPRWRARTRRLSWRLLSSRWTPPRGGPAPRQRTHPPRTARRARTSRR